jgi:cyclase
VKENLNYLAAVKKAVKAAARRRAPQEFLESITIEQCGKSRVYLGGLAESLHQRNLRGVYQQMVEDGDADGD